MKISDSIRYVGVNQHSIDCFEEQAENVQSFMENILKSMFGTEYEYRQTVIKRGGTLGFGNHVLNFIAAPNVLRPEVMFMAVWIKFCSVQMPENLKPMPRRF